MPTVVPARARLDAADYLYGFLPRHSLIITLKVTSPRWVYLEFLTGGGFFRSLDELSATAGLLPALLKSLVEMSAQMRTQKEYKRQ